MKLSKASKVAAIVATGAFALSGCSSGSSASPKEPTQHTIDTFDWPDAEPVTATVPGWMWVDVVAKANGEPFDADDACGAEYGATLTTMKESAVDLLVSYQAPPHSDTRGTPCDSGDMVIINAEKFASMTTDFKLEKKAYADNEKVVKELINDVTRVSGATFWVDVEPKTANSGSCIIEKDAHLIEIGTTDSKTLVRFMSDSPDGPGTLCDDGTDFFVDSADFDALSKAGQPRE